MATAKITDTYLPSEHWGAVEARILKCAFSLAGPIVPPDEIESSEILRFCASPIDSCIRNLTHRFDDGPTWFIITESNTVNAMIARFSGFQCIVVSRSFYVYSSLLLSQLLSWLPLRTFLTKGTELTEPSTEPERSRIEALHNLLDKGGVPSLEVKALSVSLCYLIMYLLTAHELGHLALGHLEKNQQGQMVESGIAVEKNAERRALEWDADGFALAATQWLVGSEFRRQPGWNALLTDMAAGMRFVSVASYVMFTIMDMHSDQDRSPEARTHPRPLVRAGLACYTLARAVHTWGASEGAAVIDTMRSTARSVEITLHELAGGVMEPELALTLTDELLAEIKRLELVHHSTLPTLDRSRLEGLAWAGPFVRGYLPTEL